METTRIIGIIGFYWGLYRIYIGPNTNSGILGIYRGPNIITIIHCGHY